MHYAWTIKKNIDLPQNVPPKPGVNIDWVHLDAAGLPDIPLSRSAAIQMVAAYQITALPALQSRHTERRAVDMAIAWDGDLAIRRPDDAVVTIATMPRDGTNVELHAVGKAYGVIKATFADDPHWSVDGS
jgi:hypothetical protein